MPRLVFAGSSDFAVPSLAALVDGGWDLAGVLSQPDRPAGRRRRLTATPVRAYADEHAIPVQTPESLRTAEAVAAVAALRPDALVVVDYGLILPPAVLALPAARLHQWPCLIVAAVARRGAHPARNPGGRRAHGDFDNADGARPGYGSCIQNAVDRDR
jgi:hypothetical protein